MFFFQVAFLELVMPYTNNNVIYPLKRYLAKQNSDYINFRYFVYCLCIHDIGWLWSSAEL